MSFIWKAPQPLKSREQIAREVHAVSLARGLDEHATVLCLMCISVESDYWCPWNAADPQSKEFPYDSQSDDGLSVGYYQQQVSRPDAPGRPWGWGGLFGDREGCRKRMTLRDSTDLFLAAVPNSYGKAAGSAVASGEIVANVQKCAPEYRGRYATKWNESWALLRRALAEGPVTPATPIEGETKVTAVTGDPVWLEDVLRADLGDRLVVEPDWKERGVGQTMTTIWGTMIHHTGNVKESVKNIRDGVDQGPPNGFLSGPLSQGLILPDGTFHLIAVGPCNHAGGGNWKGLTDGNRQAIGFECAYNGSGPWPQKQIITMRDAAAAISKFLKKKAADSVCGHKEYAKPQGRKPDPGNMDMDWFRGEVQLDIDGHVFPGEQLQGIPPTVTRPDYDALVFDQVSGRWEMLGWNTQIETLAELRDSQLGTKDAGKSGFTRGARPAK